MAARRSIVRRIIQAGRVPGLAVFCLLVSFTPFFRYLDLKSYDVLLRLNPNRPPGDHVVVVGIDDRSIAALGRLPWDRRVVAHVISRISSGKPASIGVDLFFDVASDTAADEFLARSIEDARRVVLPAALVSPVSDERAAGKSAHWIESLAAFRPAATGHANSSPDSDGVCRRLSMARAAGERRLWAFGLELYRVATGIENPILEQSESLELGSLRIPAQRTEGYEVLLHYASDERPIKQVSAIDVLSPDWNPDFLAGRMVVVGVVSLLEADALFTPVSVAGKAMPGVFIHANLVNMLFEKRLLREGGLSTVLAGMILIVIAVWYSLEWSRSRWQWIFVISLTLFAIAGTALSFWYLHWVLPLPTFLFAALTTTAVFHIERLSTVRGALRSEIRELARQVPEAASARDAESLAVRALQALLHETAWDWVELTFRKGERELLHSSAGAVPSAGADDRTAVYASAEYTACFRFPIRDEDGAPLNRLGPALARDLAARYRILEIRSSSPRWREIFRGGYDQWQLGVLRQIGIQFQTDDASARAILECMGGGIALLDITGRVVFANPTARKLLPFLGADSAQDFLALLVRESLLDEAAGARYSKELGRPGFSVIIPAHAPRWARSDLELTLSAIHTADGVLLGAVVAVADVTDRTQLEAARKETVMLVAHELRTPLTSIHGFAQQLERYSLDPERVRHVAGILLRESGRLERMTRAYLDLTRLELQGARNDFEIIDLSAVAISAVDGLRAAAETSNASLRLEAPKEPLFVRASSELLERAVSNLVGNAIKYSRADSEVGIRIYAEDQSGFVEVRDRGVGIPPEELSRIFDKFYRVKSAAASGVPGSGLGLAFVREVALQHGGSVTVDSRLGEGSTFRLLVPLWRSP